MFRWSKDREERDSASSAITVNDLEISVTKLARISFPLRDLAIKCNGMVMIVQQNLRRHEKLPLQRV
jgi:hypothetical protein